MKNQRNISLAAFIFLSSATSAWSFQASFKWCGGGSPIFNLEAVPKGTTILSLHMIDLDFAAGNHGGGDIVYTGQKNIPCGALGSSNSNYRGPAPPKGPHKYRFTIWAIDSSGKELARTTSERLFPEN